MNELADHTKYSILDQVLSVIMHVTNYKNIKSSSMVIEVYQGFHLSSLKSFCAPRKN